MREMLVQPSAAVELQSRTDFAGRSGVAPTFNHYRLRLDAERPRRRPSKRLYTSRFPHRFFSRLERDTAVRP